MVVNENCSCVQMFCLFVQTGRLHRTQHSISSERCTVFSQHRLAATTPWSLISGGKLIEEKSATGSKISSPDLEHFAMLSCGNCWLSVEGISGADSLTGGDCILLARDTSIVMRDSPRTRPRSTLREIASRDNSDVAHHGVVARRRSFVGS